MSRAKPITPKELAEIKQSVAQAMIKKWEQLGPIKDFRTMLRREAKLSPSKRLQLRMLFSLRFMRDLRENPIPEVIARAVEENDLQFFIDLGSVLSVRPRRAEDYQIESTATPRLSKLEQFILSHWAAAKDGLPELFYLTPEDLAAVCNNSLKMRSITPDAVVKLRQRLGLKPFKRQKLETILVGNKLRFPQLDKKSFQNPVHDE